jgi:hypothetical protein
LGSSIRKNLALEGSRGYRIARSELMGPLHLRTHRFRTHLPQVRRTIGNTCQPRTIREAILTWLGAGLASAEPVRLRSGLFADFLRKLERLDEAGRCAFCWI